MKTPTNRLQTGTAVLFALALFVAGCGGSQEVVTTEPEPAPEPAQTVQDAEPVADVPAASAEPVARSVPYEGALPPSDAPLPPTQQPVSPAVEAALDVLWQRPSPMGPEPVPVDEPKAIYVVGEGPVIQALPGPSPFPDRIPEYLRSVLPENVPYSNNVERLSGGTIRLVAFDRTANDTKLSSDSMAVEIAFTDAEGAAWRIEQAALAPLSSNPIAEPWFGGLVIDTLYHGDTGNGTPLEPKVDCAMCSWGWADVYKDDARVASSVLLHLMVTSDTRGDDFEYACYDCTDRPVRQVHVVVPPREYLPSPGGFLHVMWQDAEIMRGTPDEIAAVAPDLGEDVPTIELSAVPYLKWDREEIRVEAGRKYRLLVHNNDPSSLHQIRIHPHPESGGHGGDAAEADVKRHNEGGFAGGFGPLWKPEDEHGGGHDEGPPPGPQNVFFPIPQGATWATFVQFDEPGEYPFMCPVGNHKMRGMRGHFTVTESGGGGR
jgi:hypothetical protein